MIVLREKIIETNELLRRMYKGFLKQGTFEELESTESSELNMATERNVEEHEIETEDSEIEPYREEESPIRQSALERQHSFEQDFSSFEREQSPSPFEVESDTGKVQRKPSFLKSMKRKLRISRPGRIITLGGSSRSSMYETSLDDAPL